MKATLTAILLTVSTLTGLCNERQDSIFTAVYQKVEADLGLDTMPVSIRIQDAFFTDVNEPTDNPAAATQRLRNSVYLINIYFTLEEDRLIKAFIHELVHVAQMQSGRLQVERRYIIFDGHIYTKSVPYKNRPFEVEAVSISEELYAKYF